MPSLLSELWLAGWVTGTEIATLARSLPSRLGFLSESVDGGDDIVINVVKIQMDLEFGSTFNNPISPFPKDDIPPIYCYTNDTIYIQWPWGPAFGLAPANQPSIHRSLDFRKATDQC